MSEASNVVVVDAIEVRRLYSISGRIASRMVENVSDLDDVVGFWSELKLEIIEKYLPAYTTILSNQGTRFRFIYVDAFAGSGQNKHHIAFANRTQIAVNGISSREEMTWRRYTGCSGNASPTRL